MGKKKLKIPTEEEFNQVVESVALLAIYLRSLNSQCRAPSVEGLQLTYAVDADYEFQNEDILICTVTMVVTGERKNGDDSGDSDEEDLGMEVRAEYNAVYSLNGLAAGEAVLTYFAKANAPYNVFPYFRELIDNLSWRMGVGPLVLPLMKPKASKKPDLQHPSSRGDINPR